MLRIRHHRRHGQATAEFALLFPLIAVLLAGVIDVGRGFYARVVLINAVREGARYGARHPSSESGIRDAVKSELQTTSLRTVTDNDISISTPDGTDVEDPISVTAVVNFTPFMGYFLGISNIPIRATATMMIEIGA